jgi:hypothetical protein
MTGIMDNAYTNGKTGELKSMLEKLRDQTVAASQGMG